jgi:Tol biopolymer transport system component
MSPEYASAVELVQREADPRSGAEIYQLTSCPAINDHIYFEVPYMDAGSRYVLFTRRYSSVGSVELWRADLERSRVTQISEPLDAVRGYAVSPDQRYFYCTCRLNDWSYQLLQVDISTLEERRWAFSTGGAQLRSLGGVTPDLRYYIQSAYLGNKRYGIVRLDLESGAFQVIHDRGQDLCNAHPQVDPSGSNDILIQHNRGAIADEDGSIILLVGEIGATLYLIDIDGEHHRTLPVGKPHTGRVQGHQCWIGKTGEILLTIGGPKEELIEAGNLLALRPGDAQARVVANGTYFDHANASRDGRFFVSDTSPDAEIVVGSIRTGKWRPLCSSGSSLSRPQYTHPHPYFSPDNRWVIYNSDRTGIPHVFAAKVPDGLLAELDR